MNKIASLCSAFVFLTAVGSVPVRASDGGDGGSPEVRVVPRGNCSGAVDKATKAVAKAEATLAALNSRGGTQAELKAAKRKLAKAKKRLQNARAGKC